LLALLVASSAALAAQTFDAVSIRPNPRGAPLLSFVGRLESGRGPVEVVVIDTAAQPREQ